MAPIGPPWAWQPGLKSLVEEAGIDFDAFIEGLKNGESDLQLASRFGASQTAVRHFREHFEKYGIDSVTGQD